MLTGHIKFHFCYFRAPHVHSSLLRRSHFAGIHLHDGLAVQYIPSLLNGCHPHHGSNSRFKLEKNSFCSFCVPPLSPCFTPLSLSLPKTPHFLLLSSARRLAVSFFILSASLFCFSAAFRAACLCTFTAFSYSSIPVRRYSSNI